MQKLHTPSVVHALAAAVLLAASGFSMAQTDAAAKPAAKPAAKKQPVVNPSSRTNLKSAAKNVAAGIEAAEAALTPAELAIAERVHVGKLPCELGAAVDLTADPKAPGYFNVSGKNFKYRMFPVATTTGAIRLEDHKAGAVWLQLANKSMLMNQKLGVRLADECMSPAQLAVAEAIKLNPPASVLDAPKPAVAAAPAAAAPVASDAQPVPAAAAAAAQPASTAK
ncbi:hypothetical protein SAMN05720382_104411 [Polaromonas sp. JS666]|nr:hypothetical protein [Polaromonas sp. JS666]SDN32519.1 hypothetical protein SAMN05720382_104411 [Polaromonas sp. JS666]